MKCQRTKLGIEQRFTHFYSLSGKHHQTFRAADFSLKLMMFSVFPQIPLWKQKSGHGDQPVIWVRCLLHLFIPDCDDDVLFWHH